MKFTQYVVRIKGGGEYDYFIWEWHDDGAAMGRSLFIRDANISKAATYDDLRFLKIDIEHGKFRNPKGGIALTEDMLEIVQLDVTGTVLPQQGN